MSAAVVFILCSVGLALATQVVEDPHSLAKRQYGQVPDQQPQAQHQPQYAAQPQFAAQPQYSAQPQYAAQPPQALDQQQLSPDYVNYLQQLQQLSAQPQQAAPQQYSFPSQQQIIPQSLQSTAPQSFQSQAPPPRRANIPPEQRLLQESLARRPLVNQEREDQRRQHLISLGIDPTALRRQMLRDNLARQAAQQAAQEEARKQLPSAEEQLAAFFADAGPQQIVPHIQSVVPVPQSIPVRQQVEEPSPQSASLDQHQRVSYSQFSLGSSGAPKPQYAGIPDAQQQQYLFQPQQPVQRAAQYAPQPQPQASYDQEYLLRAQKAAQQQAAGRSQERTPQIIYHSPQQVTYIEATDKQSQLPQQYLIETTKPQEQQNTVLIPRRQQLSYRPQANYQDFHASLAAQQQRAHLKQQQLEAATTPASPPKSAIFVTTARTPTPKAYSSLPEYRIPASEQQRPLTQSELKALINAGFSVTPSPNQPEYQEYFRGLASRQGPPRVGRVPLSDEDRQQLAKNGIRNLYKVQGAESRDTPVTYVLAIDNQKRA